MECRVFGLLKKAVTAKGRVGVAFGRDLAAVAVVRREAGGAPVLERCETVPYDRDNPPEAVAQLLQKLGLPRLPASAVLRPEDYQLALVEAPDVPPAELRAAMRWRLREAIDFRVEEAVIDVIDVPSQGRSGQSRMLYAVAARRSAVERHAAQLAGVAAFDVVDVPELCLRNLAALVPTADRGVALLHLGETAATVVLVRARTFYFARQMDLQATLRYNLNADKPVEGRVDPTGVVLELQRSLDYYERHFDQPPITRIAIAPAGPRADMLAADLHQETGLEVEALDLNALLRCPQPVEPPTQAACLLAVGAALREEHRSL
jgi:MSHA biogenesis protein MshI